jgi:DNA-binding winged helix-turn-helix (wHTH) protein/Tol biopolymer transport system component
MLRNEGRPIVRFGLYEVDLQTGELRRNGQKVRLQEQPFQVLAMLLEKPGVVTREELRARLWPSDTFVDFDHGLNAAVKRLRDALGDSAENPRFVETLARRGYRFIAPVEANLTQAGTSNKETAEMSRPAPKRNWWLASAVATILLAVAAAGWFAGRKSVVAVSPENRALTGNPENDPIWQAAISPDGKYLAFTENGGFFLRVLQSGETHALPDGNNLKAHRVSWFPDSVRVLATRREGPDRKPGIWSVSALGGSVLKLIEDADSGSVSPDGTKIAFLRGDFNRQELWVADAEGEHAKRLVGIQHGEYGSLTWSPDGKHLAFLHHVYRPDFNGGDVSLEVSDAAATAIDGPAGAPAPYVVLSSSRLWNALAWTPDNRLIYSLSEPPPNRTDSNLWEQEIDPRTFKAIGAPTRLTSGPDGKARLALSADGKRLSYLRLTYAPHIYISNVDERQGQLGPLRRMSLDEHSNYPYDWTPDGKSIIFRSDRDGVYHLFKQGLDEPAPELLVGGDKNVMLARMDPQGTGVLYLLSAPPGDPSYRMQLMRVPVSGGIPQLVLTETAVNNFQCARQSDVCVLSQYSPERLTFYKFDLGTGKETLLKTLLDPEWSLFNWSLSPDGSLLALAKKERATSPSEIYIHSLNGSAPRNVKLNNWFALDYIDWAADGTSLWVNALSAAGTPTLLRVELNGKVTPALEEPEMELGWAIPSRDGRQVSLWRGEQSSNAWLLEHF